MLHISHEGPPSKKTVWRR